MPSPTPTIRIFKPGTFTDIHGRQLTFTRADLEGVVSSYDAASDPAPLVIGHPSHDHPAYGWVGKLTMDDDHIVAHPSDIEPAFGEAVAARRYRKVSASFYQPTDPSNPKPGAWYLKHVGFLGAAAPAVKGLGTVAFSEAADCDLVTFDLNPETQMTDPDPRAAAFAEREEALDTRTTELDTRTGELDAREAELDQRAAAFAERDEAEAQRAVAARHAANVSFAETQIAAGRLAPAGKDRVIGLMDQLDATATVSFGEGDANAMTPLAAFQSLFDGAGPVVAFGEHAPADKAGPTDRSPADIAQAAVAFQEEERAAGRVVSAQAAVRHVIRADADAA